MEATPQRLRIPRGTRLRIGADHIAPEIMARQREAVQALRDEGHAAHMAQLVFRLQARRETLQAEPEPDTAEIEALDNALEQLTNPNA
jgi:hypothetical protein